MRGWLAAGMGFGLLVAAQAWAQAERLPEPTAAPQPVSACSAARTGLEEHYLSTDPAVGGSGKAGTLSEAEEVLGPEGADPTGANPTSWWERAFDASIMYQPTPCAPVPQA